MGAQERSIGYYGIWEGKGGRAGGEQGGRKPKGGRRPPKKIINDEEKDSPERVQLEVGVYRFS